MPKGRAGNRKDGEKKSQTLLLSSTGLFVFIWATLIHYCLCPISWFIVLAKRRLVSTSLSYTKEQSILPKITNGQSALLWVQTLQTLAGALLWSDSNLLSLSSNRVVVKCIFSITVNPSSLQQMMSRLKLKARQHFFNSFSSLSFYSTITSVTQYILCDREMISLQKVQH